MGRRLSIGDESLNIRELSSFRSYWSDSDEYPEQNFGNNIVRMPVSVTYTYAGGRSEINFTTELKIFVSSGPEDGQVDLDDTAKIRIEDFHLRFQPAYQDYSYDEQDHTLTISDSSPKMGGDYRVVITPTLATP